MGAGKVLRSMKCRLGFHKWGTVEIHTREDIMKSRTSPTFKACIMKRCSVCGDLSYPTREQPTSIHIWKSRGGDMRSVKVKGTCKIGSGKVKVWVEFAEHPKLDPKWLCGRCLVQKICTEANYSRYCFNIAIKHGFKFSSTYIKSISRRARGG